MIWLNFWYFRIRYPCYKIDIKLLRRKLLTWIFPRETEGSFPLQHNDGRLYVGWISGFFAISTPVNEIWIWKAQIVKLLKSFRKRTNDTKLEPFSWRLNIENLLFSICVGVCIKFHIFWYQWQRAQRKKGFERKSDPKMKITEVKFPEFNLTIRPSLLQMLLSTTFLIILFIIRTFAIEHYYS